MPCIFQQLLSRFPTNQKSRKILSCHSQDESNDFGGNLCDFRKGKKFQKTFKKVAAVSPGMRPNVDEPPWRTKTIKSRIEKRNLN
jgi:hypothetical protein